MAIDTPQTRRWFQFRLRTLLVLVTVFSIGCAWIGSQAHFVRQRKAMINAIRNDGGIINLISEGRESFGYLSARSPSIDRHDDGMDPKVSFVRLMLGDEPVPDINLSNRFHPATLNLEEIQRLFPEAEIHVMGY